MKKEKKIKVQKKLNNLIQNEALAPESTENQLFQYFYKFDFNIPRPVIEEIFFENECVKIKYDSPSHVDKNLKVFVGNSIITHEVSNPDRQKDSEDRERGERGAIVELFFEEGKITKPTISKLYRDMLRDLFIGGLFFLKFLKSIPAD